MNIENRQYVVKKATGVVVITESAIFYYEDPGKPCTVVSNSCI